MKVRCVKVEKFAFRCEILLRKMVDGTVAEAVAEAGKGMKIT